MAVDVMLPECISISVVRCPRPEEEKIQRLKGFGRTQMTSAEVNERVEGSAVLEDSLTVHPKHSIQYRVTLTREEVKITPLSNARRRSANVGNVPTSVSLKDVTGCLLMKNRDQEFTAAYFCIYYYPYRKKILGKKCRQRQQLTFMVDGGESFTENKYRAARWKTMILHFCRRIDSGGSRYAFPLARKHHLVLLNPLAGNGKGMQTYEQIVKPMFIESEMDYEMVVTAGQSAFSERANHARDMMRDLPLDKFDGIIVLSGDGLVHEVLNGLMARTDWENAIKMPIGIVPVGSGNALAAAITYRAGESYASHFIQHCTFVLLRHVVAPMDLMIVETANQKLISFLSTTWGFVADVDIESEKYRKLGGIRFTVGALLRILSLKTYRGRLSFLPDKPYVSRQRSRTQGANALKRSLTTSGDDVIANGTPKRMAKSESLPYLAFRTRSASQQDDEAESPSQDLETMMSDFQDENCNTNHALDLHVTQVNAPRCLAKSTIPPLSEPVPSDWVTVEEDYIMVSAFSLSHLARDFIVHPEVKWDDGLVTLCIVRAGINKAQLLSMMLAMEDGSHVNNPNIEFIQCHAFRLEPLTPQGCIAVDGELIEYGPLQVQIMPQYARIMTASEA